ncbi:MAG: aromatic ring-hydroxylating dioxygenase subunit alpha [Alphaproteobacteria bacterium]
MPDDRASEPRALARKVTLPAWCYRDADLYQRERREIFAKCWQLFAHEDQLREPGAYVADTVAGFPLFVLRGRDGALRGFHNVCRHRAAPLVDAGQGRCDVLRCRYHGWLYDHDGNLKKTPLFGEDASFDPAEFGLFPIRVESWRGFVMVNIDRDAAPFAAAHAGFIAECAELPLEDYRFHSRLTHPVACNWKTYVENYLEAYHVPYVHPALSKEVDVGTYQVLPRDGYMLHVSPPRSPGQARVNQGFWAFALPNWAFNVYGVGAAIERMKPDGLGGMVIDYLYMFAKDAGDAAVADALAMSRVTTAEDARICEQVQVNLDAGVYETGRVSPRYENGLAEFHAWVAARMGLDV